MKRPTHLLSVLLALSVVLVGATAAAKEINVDAKGSPTALRDALNAAATGDVIVLAPGEYAFNAPKPPIEGRRVTVRAAKGAAGKVIVSRLDGSYSLVRFEGLVIPEAVRIRKGRWVQFVRCTFAPTAKEYFWGASFQDCDNCGLYGCVVKTLSGSQINMDRVRNAEYRFNEVANSNSDAFQGGGDGILIEGNWVHDMHPTPKAHPDGIQLFNTKNLTVRGNVFDTWNAQTFFFSWTAKETNYENFILENNVCTTAQYHGLTTHPSSDMLIRNNLFICDAQYKSGSEAIDLKNMQGKLTVQNNLFWQLSVAPRANDTISHNIYMQKHWRDGLPGTAAVLSSPEACFTDRATRDYRLKPGSPAIGAALPGTVPATDVLGRPRSKDKPSIGPLEPQPNDAPFMTMWLAYFNKMQAEVEPPEPTDPK